MADGPFYCVVTADAIDDLLAEEEIQTIDKNVVRALVDGEIQSFMGFNFVHTEQVPVDSNGYSRIPVYAANGLGLAVGMEPRARISERADKRYSTYVYWAMSVGAVRLQEEKVVEIKVDNSA